MFNFDKNIYVLDGGMGMLVKSLGFKAAEHPLWSSGANIERPDLVLEAHKRFIQAGAEIITTNTYGANIRLMLDKLGMSLDEANNHIKTAAKIATQAIQGSGIDIKIVASIGSYASYFKDHPHFEINPPEFNGEYIDFPEVKDQDIYDYFRNQIQPFLELNIKTFAFETISNLPEVKSALKVLNDLKDNEVSAWISVTCKDGEHLRHGEKFEDFVKTMVANKKVFAIGINCTEAKNVTSLLKIGSGIAGNENPFVVYPYGAEFDGEKFTPASSVSEIVDSIPEWHKLGVRIIGGCCEVMPEGIQQIASACKKI